MRKLLFAVACLGLLALPVMAQDVPGHLLHVTNSDGGLETGWVVSIPSGSSDYFNSRYDGIAGRPVAGVGIGSADFGAGSPYPIAGLADANLTVDGSGNSPDLSTGVTVLSVTGGGAVFNYVYGDTADTTPAADPQHVYVQFPPGDPGLLGVGQDNTAPQGNFSGWTQDGYGTPANGVTGDFGLNVEVDILVELAGGPGICNAALNCHVDVGDETGDFATVNVSAGGDFGISVHTSCSGSLWALFLSFLGAPIKKAGPVLPTFPSGGGGWFRAGSTWPFGFGGFTFNFVAVAGVPGTPGTVHVSSEVTIIVAPDPGCNWGVKDDGTYESGWVVSIPAGTSDYFNVNFNCYTNPFVNNIIDIKIAVMDFGTTATGYPIAGAADANLGLDPSGWTTDLTSIVASVAPFTFPPGTFASTSGLNIVNDFPDVPYGSFADDNIHGFLQYPPGDSGLLGTGGDTTPSPGIAWGSHWTLDGWATPTNRFDGTAGWGIRLGSN